LPAGIHKGDAVTVSIRPENLEIAKDGNHEDNVLKGVVDSLIFLGELCDCRIAVGKQNLRIRLHPSIEVHEGESIVFKVPPKSCSVMKLDQTAPSPGN
jgi:iron(III) transport system ATP-binding protein